MSKKWKILAALAMAKAPEPVAQLWFMGRRTVIDGRTIDAKALAVGEFANMVRIPGYIPTPEESRAGLRKMVELMDEPGPDLARVEDASLPGPAGDIPVRLYDPREAGDDKRPVMVFFHGGGGIQGDLDSHDGLCRKIAAWADITVLAVDYRLAPENPFPAGLDDCVAVLRQVLAGDTPFGLDPARVAVGGDSAGGNLTAASLHVLNQGGEALPKLQVLIYPNVDYRMDSPSFDSLEEAYIIPKERCHFYRELCTPDDPDFHVEDPRVTPLLSPVLAGQPEALVINAGHDPLRDEAEFYSEALTKAGVTVEHVEYRGQIHAFVSLAAAIPQANHAIKRVADWVKPRL